MKSFKDLRQLTEKKSLKKACWDGYEAIGMKNKDGRKVPNCVPIKESKEDMACNKPTRSSKAGKKMMVKACEGGKEKLVHFGASGYGHNFRSHREIANQDIDLRILECLHDINGRRS